MLQNNLKKTKKNLASKENFKDQFDGTRMSGFQSKFIIKIAQRLTYVSPMLHFYTPWKRLKTFGFLKFSGGIEMKHWRKNE